MILTDFPVLFLNFPPIMKSAGEGSTMIDIFKYPGLNVVVMKGIVIIFLIFNCSIFKNKMFIQIDISRK
jgi:hypothetical protein